MTGQPELSAIHTIVLSQGSGHMTAVIAKLTWHRGASPMTIIDSQVHAYEANTAKRPWHSVPNWPLWLVASEGLVLPA